ncbi:hypothetical protein FJY94_02300 [Candidatus Kaiserbacteria bacterium]|nr:hypothetical protein [Candidatus Kaiserbacteria bacterium]
MNRIPRYLLVRERAMDDIARPVRVSPFVLALSHGERRKRVAAHVRRSVPVASVAAVFILCASSIGITYGSPATHAFFADIERSNANVLTAGELALMLSATPTTYTFGDGTVPDILASAAAPVLAPGSFPATLRVSFDETGGVPALCAALALSATGTPFIYSGTLLSFSATTSSFAPFTFDVLLPNDTGLADGDTCALDIVYRAWAADTPENTGYTDEKRVPYSFTYHAPAPLFVPLMIIDETPPTADLPADPPVQDTPADQLADPPQDPPADPPTDPPVPPEGE